MNTSALLTSAVLGILAGAGCSGTRPQPSTSVVSTPEENGHKAGCGNHEPGKCATVGGKPAPLARSDEPLRVSRTETIAPGKALEVNLSFASATATKATFRASAPVAWNVHSHPAGGVIEHQKGAGAFGEIAFEPTTAGVYSFLWKNDGAAALTIELTIDADRSVVELGRD